MIIWGLNVVAVKYLVSNLPPLLMQGTRIFVAGTAAITVLYFLKDLRKLTKREWLFALFAAIFGQLGHHAFLAIGLMETSATNAGLILGLVPLATVIFTMIFLKERPSFARFIGIILGFAGVSFVVLQSGNGIGTISKGDVFIFIAMISQAFSLILIKKVTATLSARQLTAIMLLIGALIITTASFIFEQPTTFDFSDLNNSIWIVFFSSAIIATGVGHILYNAAIEQIGAGETAIFNNLVPFFSLVGAFFLLGEEINFTQIIGFLFIVVGVILGTGYLEMKILQKKSPIYKKIS